MEASLKNVQWDIAEATLTRDNLISSIESEKSKISRYNKIWRETGLEIKCITDDEEMKQIKTYVLCTYSKYAIIIFF